MQKNNMKIYTANLILLGKIKKSLEFEAKDMVAARKEIDDSMGMLIEKTNTPMDKFNGGLWIEVKEKRVFEHQETRNEN